MSQKGLIYWKPETAERVWIPIQNTPEARAKAISNGAMFFTWASVSHEPKPRLPEPNRWGDLPLDADCKDDPAKALGDLRRLTCFFLPEKYGIDPWDMRFFCSGSKGFNAEIPAHFFGLQDGHPQLPLIFKRLVQRWVDELGLTTIDLSMYSMQRGKMWRIPNVKRSNGRYKVPISRDDFGYGSIEYLWSLSDAPRRA